MYPGQNFQLSLQQQQQLLYHQQQQQHLLQPPPQQQQQQLQYAGNAYPVQQQTMPYYQMPQNTPQHSYWNSQSPMPNFQNFSSYGQNPVQLFPHTMSNLQAIHRPSIGVTLPEVISDLPQQQSEETSEDVVMKEEFVEIKKQEWLDSMGPTWKESLQNEFGMDYFRKLIKYVETERHKAGLSTDQKSQVYPPASEVFAWTRYCKMKDVKVVILGQDPYPQPGKAHGLAFSVKGNRPSAYKDSVDNIIQAVKNEYPYFEDPGHRDLTRWAKQGVLLLNTVLTFHHKDPKAQKNEEKGEKEWEKFTDAVIERIRDNVPGVVFMLWGGKAKKKSLKNSILGNVLCTIPPKQQPEDIDGWTPEYEMQSALECYLKNSDGVQQNHLVFTVSHPSPISAYHDFFRYKQFSLANKWLCWNGRTPIDWTAL